MAELKLLQKLKLSQHYSQTKVQHRVSTDTTLWNTPAPYKDTPDNSKFLKKSFVQTKIKYKLSSRNTMDTVTFQKY